MKFQVPATTWRIITPFAFLAVSGLLSGCLFGGDPENPYAGLDCAEREARMQKELAGYDVRFLPPTVQKKGAVSLPESPTLLVWNRPPSEYDTWVPPFGYPEEASLPDTGMTQDRDMAKPIPFSRYSAYIAVTSLKPYRADIRIYDYKNDLVADFRETFGYHGEMQNVARIMPTGFGVTFPWNGMDRRGNFVSIGTYLWDMTFRFEDGKVVRKKAKTALWGHACDDT